MWLYDRGLGIEFVPPTELLAGVRETSVMDNMPTKTSAAGAEVIFESSETVSDLSRTQRDAQIIFAEQTSGY